MKGLIDRINTPSERTLVVKTLSAKTSSSSLASSPVFTTALTIEGSGRILYLGGCNKNTSTSRSLGTKATIDGEVVVITWPQEPIIQPHS